MFEGLMQRERSFSLPDAVAFVLAVVLTVSLLVGGVAAAQDLGRYAVATRALPGSDTLGAASQDARQVVFVASHDVAEQAAACDHVDRAGDVRYGDHAVVAEVPRGCAESRAQ
ncbi:MAG: hypothetical protein KC635_27900 [Myxococcales bacterium]|nr:hypothetical protein [Myxococcales bacterium]MCB9737255.1 hypothetical protein [Deltaproteobacteria bacterium]